MSVGDQAHGLCVLDKVRKSCSPAVEDETALEKAALLHDVGKSVHGLGLAGRTLAVMLQAAGAFDRVASSSGSHWRRRLYAYSHHAEEGARLCRAAGCPERVVVLVRWHDVHPEHVSDAGLGAELQVLREADDAC